MRRKLGITLSVLLILTGMGLAPFAYEYYNMTGHINETIVKLGTAAIITFVFGLGLLIKIGRNKPIDVSKQVTTNFGRAKLGGMLLSLGMLLFLLFIPIMYGAMQNIGSAEMFIADFPMVAAHPILYWLDEQMGPLGLFVPVVIIGLMCVSYGWKFIRPARPPRNPRNGTAF